MKKNTLALFTILASLLITSCGKAKVDTSGCYLDIEDAKKMAKKKSQDILVFITMNGEDASSQSLTDNVIRNPKFKDEIASKYITVRMDFSESSYKLSVASENASDTAKKNAEKKADTIQHNTQFAKLLNASVTPSVYILSKEVYLVSSIYDDTKIKTYDAFKKQLNDKSYAIEEMHKMIYQTKIGTAEEKMKAINALYKATAPDARHFLADLLASAKKIDPTNKSGLLGECLYSAADAKAVSAMNTGDIKKAVEAYLSVENEDSINPEDRQQSLYTAAYLCSKYELEEAPVIISYLEKSIAAAPQSDEVPAIKRVIESFK